MKKKLSKGITTALLLSLALTVMMAFTACGGPSTIEEYMNENQDQAQKVEDELAAASTDGMKVSIDYKENAMIFTLKTDETYSADEVKVIKKAFEDQVDSLASQFETTLSDLEEDSGIEDASVELTVVNGDDSEIFTHVFK